MSQGFDEVSCTNVTRKKSTAEEEVLEQHSFAYSMDW